MSAIETSTVATPVAGVYSVDRGETESEHRKRTSGVRTTKQACNTTTAESVGEISFQPPARNGGTGNLDVALLDRATELLDGIETAGPEEKALAIESLRCVTCELWPSAAAASQYHQSALALVEGMVLSHDDLTPNQAAALRGAVKALSSKSLNENYLDVLRSRFVDDGYNPLAILSCMEGDGPRDETQRGN